MGRQIGIIFSDKKEKEFEEFLLKNKEVVFISPWSDNKKLNILKNLPPRKEDYMQLYIWNKKFKFKPQITEIEDEYKKSGANFTFDFTGKPVIEFSRSIYRNINQVNNFNKGIGRIYWEKYFSLGDLNYDTKEFEKWYNSVVRWIKKNCNYKNGIYIDK